VAFYFHMKKLLLTILLSQFILKNQGHSQDNQAKEMLKKFYTEYNIAWSTNKGYVLIKKLDSLQSQYCTLTLRKELKKEFKRIGLDHDELINDDYTDEAHLNTLKIIKVPNKANGYVVSYTVFAKDVSNKPVQEKIVIHVNVAKVNGSFKIASVDNY
jgi:hypothetical protein